MLSYTAQIIAGRRALATKQKSKYINDPYAHLFVTDEINTRVVESDAPVHGILLRNRLFEDFATNPPHNIEQMIILGSGFDCKFQKHILLQKLRYIEVDDPEMVEYKKNILHQNKLPIPEMIPLRINGIDDIQSIIESTDKNKSTMVLAEGITMYQPEGFIFDIYTAISQYYDKIPCLGFDFLDRNNISNNIVKGYIKNIQDKGEYMTASYSQKQVKDFFASHKVQMQMWDADRKQRHYLNSSWQGIYPLFNVFVCSDESNWTCPDA